MTGAGSGGPPGGAEPVVARSRLDGRVLEEIPAHDAGAVAEAVARARAAQEAWGALDVRSRARRLRVLARVLEERGEEIAGRVREETGKPLSEALTEVAVSADLVQHYVRTAPRTLARRRVERGWLLGKSAWVEREPWGVVGAITAWNYPFILAMDCVAAALFAGNAVVVKPSELTSWTALLLPELAADAGLPEGLVSVVVGAGDTGRALVDAGVDRVVFTGSTATGRKVMAAAAERLTPVTLELGGKDPAIVLEDAPLDRAARGIVYGAFFNAGQTCISVERVLVARPLHDAFVARVVELTEELRAGPGEASDLGPMITDAQLDVVERHVADAVARGATVRAGGERARDHDETFLPTVLTDVEPDMDVWTRETFGPVLPVVPFDDEDEAVRLAGAGAYGLFASVWTGDRKRGLRLGRRLRSGGFSVNDVLSHYAVPGLPVGGTGDSGFGRRRGREALEEMSRTRSVLVDRSGLRRELWWFPYSEGGRRLVRAVLSWRARRGLGGLWAALRTWMGKGRQT